MDARDIRTKFGDHYLANQRTFTMGIDLRFTVQFADRVRGRTVLETCTGGGFTTISLARTARQVHTVDIDQTVQAQARLNVERAKVQGKVTFITGNILDPQLIRQLPPVDAAFLDPDWAVSGPDHAFCFQQSNTEPPADTLLNTVLGITGNVALVLPPHINPRELAELPDHECQRMYLDGRHELFCLYFGDLAAVMGETEFHA